MTPDGVQRRWTASPRAVACELATGLAILDMRTNHYFSLNGVGGFAWELLRTGASAQLIAQRISESYDVAVERCLPDVLSLLADLAKEGLIEAEAGVDPGGPNARPA